MTLPLTLHTSPHSWSAMCVDLLCQLADVRVERVPYNLTPGLWTTRASAQLRALNPARRLPVLVLGAAAHDDAFVLTESTAILRFLADHRLPHDSLWRRPNDPLIRAKIDGPREKEKRKLDC